MYLKHWLFIIIQNLDGLKVHLGKQFNYRDLFNKLLPHESLCNERYFGQLYQKLIEIIDKELMGGL